MEDARAAGEELTTTVQDTIESTGEEVSLWSQYFTTERMINLIADGILILLTLVFFVILYQVMKRVMKRVFRHQKKRATVPISQELDTLENLLQSVLFYVFLFVAGITFLSILGINMRGLIASAGVAGLAIAFISQSIIKDWVTGIFIILEKQYKVGDWVTIAGRTGQVESLGMRSTNLITDARDRITIPNGTIGDIVNHSALPHVSYIDIPAPYEADPVLVRQALDQAANQVNQQYQEILLSPVRVLGPSSMVETGILYKITFASTYSDYYPLNRAVHLESQKAYRALHIPIPHHAYGFISQDQREEGW